MDNWVEAAGEFLVSFAEGIPNSIIRRVLIWLIKAAFKNEVLAVILVVGIVIAIPILSVHGLFLSLDMIRSGTALYVAGGFVLGFICLPGAFLSACVMFVWSLFF